MACIQLPTVTSALRRIPCTVAAGPRCAVHRFGVPEGGRPAATRGAGAGGGQGRSGAGPGGGCSISPRNRFAWRCPADRPTGPAAGASSHPSGRHHNFSSACCTRFHTPAGVGRPGGSCRTASSSGCTSRRSAATRVCTGECRPAPRTTSQRDAAPVRTTDAAASRTQPDTQPPSANGTPCSPTPCRAARAAAYRAWPSADQ